jgi:glycine hydroxymethyltransferase
LGPEFTANQEHMGKTTKVVAITLTARGLHIVFGRTESHGILVDLRTKGITGKAAEAASGAAHQPDNQQIFASRDYVASLQLSSNKLN